MCSMRWPMGCNIPHAMSSGEHYSACNVNVLQMSAFKITNSRFPPTNYGGGVISHADNAALLAKETPTEKEPKHP